MTSDMIQLKSGELISKREIHTACFMMWGLIGDVFVRVAIIEAFKKAYPYTRITAVVDPLGKSVLENHPDVNQVYIFSRSKQPMLRYILKLLKGIRFLHQQHFDLNVNLYSGGSSPLITRLMRARIRLGFDHTAALRKANNLLVPHPSLCKNWTKQLAAILIPLGIPVTAVRQGTSYYCDQDSLDFARTLLENDRNQYVVFNLGARIAEKRWALSRFLALAKVIYEKYRLCPLVLTNPGMEELAAEFCRQYNPHGHVRQVPLLSLNKVAAVIRCGRFVITGDTSIMHLSFGLKLPTLVLFTYTRPEIVAPSDCPHQDCFVESDEAVDECGNPMGDPDIPLEMALEKFDVLYKQVK